MKGTVEQLSFPLFDADAGDPHGDIGTPQAKPRVARPAVVRSRRESRRVAPESKHAAEGALRERPLLTTGEAAELLHVHPRTVQRLVERGELGAIRLGAAVRFDPADVADLTARLKRREAGVRASRIDVLRPSRALRISFAGRLRSQHEHRTAQA